MKREGIVTLDGYDEYIFELYIQSALEELDIERANELIEKGIEDGINESKIIEAQQKLDRMKEFILSRPN